MTIKLKDRPPQYFWLFLTIFVLFFTLKTQAQDCKEWKKKQENGNFRVYVRECSDSPIKEFKLNDRFVGDFQKLVKVMDDMGTTKKLSDNCTEARVIQIITPDEFVQYFYFDMPTGINDRDCVTKIIVKRTPTTYASFSESFNDELVPIKKHVIRLKKVRASFYFEFYKDGTIGMEYCGRTDPNGWIPAWLVNMFAHREAKKMVEKLKKLIQN